LYAQRNRSKTFSIVLKRFENPTSGRRTRPAGDEDVRFIRNRSSRSPSLARARWWIANDLSSIKTDSLVLSDRQVREPRAAWPREVLSAFALRQLHENVRARRVGAESLDQARLGVAPGSAAAFAVDVDDVQGKLAERA
jgi:hypothetical protein